MPVARCFAHDELFFAFDMPAAALAFGFAAAFGLAALEVAAFSVSALALAAAGLAFADLAPPDLPALAAIRASASATVIACGSVPFGSVALTLPQLT